MSSHWKKGFLAASGPIWWKSITLTGPTRCCYATVFAAHEKLILSQQIWQSWHNHRHQDTLNIITKNNEYKHYRKTFNIHGKNQNPNQIIQCFWRSLTSNQFVWYSQEKYRMLTNLINSYDKISNIRKCLITFWIILLLCNAFKQKSMYNLF